MSADPKTRRFLALAAGAVATALALGLVLRGGSDEPPVLAPGAAAERAPSEVRAEATAPTTRASARPSAVDRPDVDEDLEDVSASGGDAAERYEVDSAEEVEMADRNRRTLLTRNIAHLTDAAANAEAEGNPARAELMSRRVDALSEQLDAMDAPAP